MSKKLYFSPTNKTGACIYKMPIAVARDLIDKNTPWSVVNTQEFLCGYVNDQYRLLHKCVRVDLV